MYAKGMSRSQMNAFGFRPDDWGGDVIEVMEDNLQAFDLFSKLSTQWYVGMGGCTGLNYCVVLDLIDRLCLEKEDAVFLFDDIRHMEHAALAQMSRDQDAQKK